MTSARIVAIIPARLASTRLPSKPLIDLCGKPMIQHVYERASRSRLLDRVIVATDSTEILDAVIAFGGEAVLTSASLPTGSDRVAAAAVSIKGAEIVVNIQGDEPLIDPKMIDEALSPMLIQAGAEPVRVATLVKRLTSADDLINPGVVKVALDTDGYGVYFSRSPIPYLRDGSAVQSWPARHAYYKHIGLYVYHKEVLLDFASWKQSDLELAEQLEQLRFIEHGVRIKATLTEHDTIPVDTLADAERVRELLRRPKGVPTP